MSSNAQQYASSPVHVHVHVHVARGVFTWSVCADRTKASANSGGILLTIVQQRTMGSSGSRDAPHLRYTTSLELESAKEYPETGNITTLNFTNYL